MDITKKMHFTNRVEWRSWLKKNHAREKELWLIYYKKHTGKPSITDHEAIEEAICYGWIDSVTKRIDDEKYAKRFSPRTIGSSWSELNRKRAENMIMKGLMADAGLKVVKRAQKNGNWNKDRSSNRIKQIPFEFIQALASNNTARVNFETLAPSYRKQYIGWIINAKKEKTRQKRIREALVRLENKKKLGMK